MKRPKEERVVRRTFVLLTAGLLALSLAAPGAVMAASGFTVKVPKPNHGDDTANIQTALNSCVARGPNCTVQLQEGTYHTSQLVTYNFRGTFKGAGENRTTIAALPDVLVNWPDFATYGQCLPNLTDCRWGSFIIFVDGNIEVSDLALDFPYTNGQETTPYTLYGGTWTGFTEAMKFLGDRPTSVSVDRVSVTGRHDTSPTNLFGLGYNVLQGIYFAGDLPSAPYLCGAECQTYATLSGSFAVRSSSVKATFLGILTGGASVGASRVTIGGSPAAGNRVVDVPYGISIGSESSVYDVSYNVVSSSGDGVSVVPLNFGMTPGTHSRFYIHDNTLLTPRDAVEQAQGVFIWDYPANPWIQAAIVDNTIKLGATANEGIAIGFTVGTMISGNTITGPAGYDAIGLYHTTYAVVTGNDVSGFTPNPSIGRAQIWLSPANAGGPAATHNLVVCLRRTDTVLDQGTDNRVIGCHQ
jgi:hypothetical protein